MLMPDILTKYLYPFLDWESRLNLNLTLPFDIRFIKTMSKEAILAHEKYIIVNLFRNKMDKFERLDKGYKSIAMSNIFITLLHPRNKLLYLSNSDLRKTVLAKASEFKSGRRTANHYKIPLTEALNLSSVCRHLIKTINLDIKNTTFTRDEHLFSILKAKPVELV